MTIYLDIVLIENICMNYIILFATGVINKIKMSKIRLILSSLLGSCYAVVTYISILPNSYNTILKILLSIAMVYIAFKPKSYKLLLKYILIFYLTSFAFGGCAFFLLYYLKPQDILMRNGVFVGTYPLKIALLGGILGFIIINIAFKIIKGKISKKDMIYKLNIYFDGKSVQVVAMLDTGNMLKEPITGMPVLVVEKMRLYEILPEEILDNLDNILNGKNVDIINDNYLAKFRVIPFSSLGMQNGMLLGFKPDKVILEQEEEKIQVKEVIIAIYDKSLTKTGNYTALIGLNFIEGGEKNEYISNVKV